MTCDFPARDHHCSPVIVLLLSRMVRDGGVAGRVARFRGGATFLGARLPPLWLRALHWAALLWDKYLAGPQVSSPLQSSYWKRPAACFH